MKKGILFLAACLLSTTVTFAQQTELKAAQTNVEAKKYIAALDELNKAKKVITELISSELASVLPAKFGEMVVYVNPYGGGGMETQGVSVTKAFRKPAAKKVEAENADDMANDPMMTGGDMGGDMGGEKEIRVTITTNMMMANEVQNAHSMSDEGMMNESQKSQAVRINGYRGLLKTSGGEKQGQEEGMMGQPKTEQAMVIVGGAFITVEATGLTEEGQAEKFIKLIDFAKLKGIVGE